MKFVQFCLHSIILNYNYFVYNSVDKLLIIFQFKFNLVDGGGGVHSFSEMRMFARGASSANMYKQGGRTVQKRAILCERNNWLAPNGIEGSVKGFRTMSFLRTMFQFRKSNPSSPNVCFFHFSNQQLTLTPQYGHSLS